MRTGTITIGNTTIGFVEEEIIIDNLIMDASLDQGDIVPDFTGNYNPSGRAEGSDTGKSFHHHGLGHSRPSGGQHSGKGQLNAHHFPGHPHHRDQDHKEKIKHISLGENQDPHANTAVIETMMNRAVVRGTSLEQQVKRHRSSGVDEQGYYAGYAPGYSGDKGAMVDRNIAAVLRGSNVSSYATDNSSGDLARREIESGSFRHHTTINGESFFSPGSAEPTQRDRWQALHKKAQEHERSKKDEVAMPTQTEPL